MWDDLKKTVNTAVESSKKQKHEDIGHDVEDDESREAREKKNAAKKKAKASKKTKVKKPVGDDK